MNICECVLCACEWERNDSQSEAGIKKCYVKDSPIAAIQMKL